MPNDVTSLSSLDIEAEGIATFELGDWQLPVSGVDPTPETISGARFTLGRNPILRGGSLQEAQNWLRNVKDQDGTALFAHPVYWAGFVLVGDAE